MVRDEEAIGPGTEVMADVAAGIAQAGLQRLRTRPGAGWEGGREEGAIVFPR